MHNFLQEALISSKGALGNALIHQTTPVFGGCIHKAWRLDLEDGRKLFAKTASFKDSAKLQFEAECLKALARFSTKEFLIVPQPLAFKQVSQNSVLFLPWLELSEGDEHILGQGLAKLHKFSISQNQQHFGWANNGFIGSGVQLGGWEDNWGKYFVEFRLKPQLKLGEKWGLKIIGQEKLLNLLSIFLNEHEPLPSLVHGDLWSGNASMLKNGIGTIFDPATWWADREVDLAMTRLFGGFSLSFYKGYESVWPLPSSTHSRVDIYNLYHVLNHANLFGGSYKIQSQSIINSLQCKFMK